ncbi:hypothetical protein DUNSADRAFT_4457 [Dunaliella salina]|nr:hypothetical protein DUNSADRAFT_4457 [Dunaliella salina]|eukprot:KAF5837410.1 hypothetical protein DUNSADRAFT_4457 [Dunaliella salina]
MDLNPSFGNDTEGGESSGVDSDAEEEGIEESEAKRGGKARKQRQSRGSSGGKEESVVDELLQCTSQRRGKQLQQSSKVVSGQLSYAVRIWAAAGHANKKPLQELQASLSKCVVQDGRTSELEKEVRRELAKDSVLKLQSVRSQVDVGHGWIVDMLAETASGNEVVIEVDGPQHFATCRHPVGTGVHPLGNTAIRDNSLRRLGKRVVCLAATDLDFHANKKKVIKLLREKVQGAESLQAASE